MSSDIFKNFLSLVLFLSTCFHHNCYGQEQCTLDTLNIPGTCKYIKECDSNYQDLRKGIEVTWCNHATYITCCPTPLELSVKQDVPDTPISTQRISEKKCLEYAEAVFEKTYTVPLVANAAPIEMKKDRCGFKAEPLIVGGVMAKPREFPHMALIGYVVKNETQWGCGGSLISERYILTAAHCVYALGSPKYVRLGELTISSTEEEDDPEDFTISKIFAHPDYRRLSKYNDIALLKLDRNVEFNAFKRPACLPRELESNSNKVIASGWGRTDYISTTSDYLQKVTLEKFTESECNGIHSQKIDPKLANGIQYTTQICVGSRTDDRDTCKGDSGGPIQNYHSSVYCMYDLVGITSFGILCGTKNIPGVYTRIFAYIDWIENKVWG